MSRVRFEQPIERLLLTKQGRPVAPKEAIGKTGYQLGGSPRRLLVFDAHKRLVLILRLTKDGQLRDAGLIADPQALRADFPALMAQLGVPLNDRLAWVAEQLGYRVVAGALQPVQPPPTLDDPRVSLKVSEDQVLIHFEPEERNLLEEEQDADEDALEGKQYAATVTLPPVRMTLFQTGALALDGAIQPDVDDPVAALYGQIVMPESVLNELRLESIGPAPWDSRGECRWRPAGRETPQAGGDGQTRPVGPIAPRRSALGCPGRRDLAAGGRRLTVACEPMGAWLRHQARRG